jgi:hypothetical protein
MHKFNIGQLGSSEARVHRRAVGVYRESAHFPDDDGEQRDSIWSGSRTHHLRVAQESQLTSAGRF